MTASTAWRTLSRVLGGGAMGVLCLPAFVATALDHAVGVIPWLGFWFSFMALGAGWIGRGRLARWVPVACLACAAVGLAQVMLQTPRPPGVAIITLPVALVLTSWIVSQCRTPAGPVSLTLAAADRQWLKALFGRDRAGAASATSDGPLASRPGVVPLLAGLLGVLVGSIVVMIVQSNSRLALVADQPAAAPVPAIPASPPVGALDQLAAAARLSVQVEVACRPLQSLDDLTLVCRLRNTGPTAATFTIGELQLESTASTRAVRPLDAARRPAVVLKTVSPAIVVALGPYVGGDVMLHSARLTRALRSRLARGRTLVLLRYAAQATPEARDEFRKRLPEMRAPAGFDAPVESRVLVPVGRGVVR